MGDLNKKQKEVVMLKFIENDDRKEFLQETIDLAWVRSGGRCECKRKAHGHDGRCNKELDYEQQGRDTDDYWEAHHANGDETKNDVEHCLIFCWGCHKQTFAEGAEKNKQRQRLGIKMPKK
jgi:hypothetical protein